MDKNYKGFVNGCTLFVVLAMFTQILHSLFGDEQLLSDWVMTFIAISIVNALLAIAAALMAIATRPKVEE